MSIVLTPYEHTLLNKMIPTQTFSDSAALRAAFYNITEESKEALMADGTATADGFERFKEETANNIFKFLKQNQFYAERQGGVLFITEKGKNLRRQKSLEGYQQWQSVEGDKNKVILKTIETRGYLDQDPVVRNRTIFEQIKRYVLLPLLLVAIIVAAYYVARHFHILE